MSFALRPEQLEFRDTLRRFFEDRSPPAEVRRVMETHEGVDPGLWRAMTDELGLPGVMISEEQGGQGFGIEELAIAMGELGRSLAPCPFLGSVVLAGRLLAHAGGEACEARLAEIAAGRIASLAVVEADSFSLADASMRAREGGSAPYWTLEGEKTYVLDGHHASLLLVVARDAEGALALFDVDPGASGLTRERLRTVDRTRRLARLRFENTPARQLATGIEDALERMAVEAQVALSADSVGGMETVLETAVAYAKERTQFGRAIGSFQAVKHKLADLWILVEGARTATREATLALAEGRDDAALLSSIARAYSSDAYAQATFDNIQVHGGVGFTWEYDAHLYLRRAQFAARFLGSAADHRARVAAWLERTTEPSRAA